MRIPRTILTSALAVAAAGALLAGVPAVGAQAASYPVSKFNVTVGNTYTRGTITWYSRSVTVSGVEKSVDVNGCRGTTAFTLNSKNQQLVKRRSNVIPCGTSSPFSFNVPANIPGGAAVVRVCLDTENPPDGPVKLLKCLRYGR